MNVIGIVLLFVVFALGCRTDKGREDAVPSSIPSRTTHKNRHIVVQNDSAKKKPSVIDTEPNSHLVTASHSDTALASDTSLNTTATPTAHKFGRLPGTLPRVIVSREWDVSLDGFPAISGDGAIVVVEEYFETVANDQLVALKFFDTQTGRLLERVVIYEADADGTSLPFPEDTYGKTLWRRGKTLDEKFTNEGYRTMAIIPRSPPSNARVFREYVGEGLRVFMTNQARLVVRDLKTNKKRYIRKMPNATYFCGMESIGTESKEPSQGSANLLGAWVDASKRVVVITYGFEYASCMCPNEVKHMTLRM